MRRHHVHLARGRPDTPGVISGARADCDVFIWVNVRRALRAGLRFFESSNGVLLSEGDADGAIPPIFFERIEIDGEIESEMDGSDRLLRVVGGGRAAKGADSRSNGVDEGAPTPRDVLSANSTACAPTACAPIACTPIACTPIACAPIAAPPPSGGSLGRDLSVDISGDHISGDHISGDTSSEIEPAGTPQPASSEIEVDQAALLARWTAAAAEIDLQ